MNLITVMLLLSDFSSLTLMEVVEDVDQWRSKCRDFFMPNPENQNEVITPTVFQNNTYKMICQHLNNNYRFATLYDTERRIPVYSAYTFSQKSKTNRSDEWNIEPQLEDMKNQKDMIISPRKDADINKVTHQAVQLDYKPTMYTLGHVFPRLFAQDQKQADSTFTLTNTAPQLGSRNQKWSAEAEEPMLKEIQTNCTLDQNQKAYIVTGVIPGSKWISITRNNQNYNEGINIPNNIWSAFHCKHKNDNKIISHGYITELENFKVTIHSIVDLDKQLTELYHLNFSVFPGLSVHAIDSPHFLEIL